MSERLTPVEQVIEQAKLYAESKKHKIQTMSRLEVQIVVSFRVAFGRIPTQREIEEIIQDLIPEEEAENE